MAGSILQFGCTMNCPHGGRVQVVPSQNKVLLGGQPALLATDVFTILGCPFTVGTVSMPCVRVSWTAPAGQVRVDGQAPLLQTSVGLCNNAAGAPQGNVIIAGVQTKVTAQ